MSCANGRCRSQQTRDVRWAAQEIAVDSIVHARAEHAIDPLLSQSRTPGRGKFAWSLTWQLARAAINRPTYASLKPLLAQTTHSKQPCRSPVFPKRAWHSKHGEVAPLGEGRAAWRTLVCWASACSGPPCCTRRQNMHHGPSRCQLRSSAAVQKGITQQACTCSSPWRRPSGMVGP